MDFNVEVKKLLNNKLLRTDQEILYFEEAIENILTFNEVEHIKILCSGFDDSTENEEVMFGLIHAIESYDNDFGMENSLEKMVEALPSMLPQARGWSIILHKRILNYEPSRIAYTNVLLRVDASIKKIVSELFSEIKERNPDRFEELVNKTLP